MVLTRFKENGVHFRNSGLKGLTWLRNVGVKQKLVFYGLANKKRELRTFANSEGPDQPAHPRSLIRTFALRLHNIGRLLKV